MIQAKAQLLAALAVAVRQVAPEATVEPAFETPKQASHGDLAVTLAMVLAKAQKRNPRDLAAALVAALQDQEAVTQWVAALEIAGPGFINLRLKDLAKQAVVSEALAMGESYGRQPDHGRKLMVEFVSANPTGPLHVGHGRQAALGDSICRLFESQGWQVQREFYYNDAGVQIATLANSTQKRLQGVKPGDADWPADAYNGEYIADIAAGFAAGATVSADDRSFSASADPQDLDGIAQFAVAYLRHEQDLDLKAFGVRFDHYFLESSLYADGQVAATVELLNQAGKTFEKDGALWLKSTDYGDDKDRVMRKGDGNYTYFVPDVAYHINKWQRGFAKCINVQGIDHHGTVTRVRAGLQAAGVGVPQGWPDYLLHKMVTVMKGGQEVKISKRAGSYVTLRDLIDMSGGGDPLRGRDAVRFFLISRKADTEFVFDVDLALKNTDENPVYYVQYAHARIVSVLRSWDVDWRARAKELAAADLSPLSHERELALAQKLSEFSGVVALAADGLAPHDMTFYARELAALFHTLYNERELRVLSASEEVKIARLALYAATAQVIRNTLALLGVSAPEKM